MRTGGTGIEIGQVKGFYCMLSYSKRVPKIAYLCKDADDGIKAHTDKYSRICPQAGNAGDQGALRDDQGTV